MGTRLAKLLGLSTEPDFANFGVPFTYKGERYVYHQQEEVRLFEVVTRLSTRTVFRDYNQHKDGLVAELASFFRGGGTVMSTEESREFIAQVRREIHEDRTNREAV